MLVTEQCDINSERRWEGQNIETMEYLRKVNKKRREIGVTDISKRRGREGETSEGRNERRELRETKGGGRGERRGGGRLRAEEEGSEVRMSASELPRGPHFLLRLAVVVVVLVAPLHATPQLPPQQQYSLPQLPHSIQHRLSMLLLRTPYKGRIIRSRGTRSALAPPTVTSLRPPDRSVSGQRSQGNISGSVGGSSGHISPPVVASQSPALTDNPTHHTNRRNHHKSHHRYQGSVSPVATASSGSRSWGGTQQQRTNSHRESVAWAEGEDGILIYGQGPWRRDGRTRGNRESGWNIKSDESETGNGDSSRHGGKFSGSRRVISWNEGGQNGGGEDGLVRGEGQVWREVERDPRTQEGIWREGVDGGWTTEGVAGRRGEEGEAFSRNDTFGHAITEDLTHLSSRSSQEHDRVRVPPPPPAGGRPHHDTTTRHLWVLEEVQEGEEEEERDRDMGGERMAVLDTLPPVPVSSDFLNAYLHAVQRHNDSKPKESGHSYPSSSSSPSSSHPSFTGSSSYPVHSSSSPSSSHPSFTGSSSYPSHSTYSSSSSLHDDLSPFHQSVVPHPRPVNTHEGEYEPEDYINYHEYDHRGRHQEDTLRQSNATPDQHGNVATHDNRHRTLSMQEIVRLKGLSTMDELMLLLERKGTNYHHLLELVNSGATESEVLAFLNRPDVNGAETTNQENMDGRRMGNHYPGDETEDEMDNDGEQNDEDNVTREREEQRKRKRNRKKGRRDRGRGGKNRRGRNKGRRRGRIGQSQTTTHPPLSSSTSTPTDTISTNPMHAHPPTADTTATLLPATPPTIPTTSYDSLSTFQSPAASVPEDPTGKTARVSEITVTVMKNQDETEPESEMTIVEDLRPARRRPNLRGQPPKDQYNRRHGGETRLKEGTLNRGGVGVRGRGVTVGEEPNGGANMSREQQEQYQFPVKGIMIISGLMGALAVFTLVVLISYAVIKCSKKPAVNNYQVSEQKTAVAS